MAIPAVVRSALRKECFKKSRTKIEIGISVLEALGKECTAEHNEFAGTNLLLMQICARDEHSVCAVQHNDHVVRALFDKLSQRLSATLTSGRISTNDH